jgi:hypothetical protein
MKPHPSSSPLPHVIAALLILGTMPSPAQSAEGFDTSGLAPAEPAPAKPAARPDPLPASADLEPSRYAGDEIGPYVNELTTRLSIRQRATDPFGRYQDPDYKAPEPERMANPSPTQRTKLEPPTPFADIIAAITVNMVKSQQFLIADRTFTVKDIFPIQLPSGKIVKVQVMAVSSSRIDFRNVETGETASRRLDLRPPGMTRGVGTLSAPGVQPGGADAPLQIQPVTPVSGNP